MHYMRTVDLMDAASVGFAVATVGGFGWLSVALRRLGPHAGTGRSTPGRETRS